MSKITKRDLKEQALVMQITLSMLIDIASEDHHEDVAELIKNLNEEVFRALNKLERPRSASKLRREFGL